MNNLADYEGEDTREDKTSRPARCGAFKLA